MHKLQTPPWCLFNRGSLDLSYALALLEYYAKIIFLNYPVNCIINKHTASKFNIFSLRASYKHRYSKNQSAKSLSFVRLGLQMCHSDFCFRPEILFSHAQFLCPVGLRHGRCAARSSSHFMGCSRSRNR